jgi:hypothetical protein
MTPRMVAILSREVERYAKISEGILLKCPAWYRARMLGHCQGRFEMKLGWMAYNSLLILISSVPNVEIQIGRDTVISCSEHSDQHLSLYMAFCLDRFLSLVSLRVWFRGQTLDQEGLRVRPNTHSLCFRPLNQVKADRPLSKSWRNACGSQSRPGSKCRYLPCLWPFHVPDWNSHLQPNDPSLDQILSHLGISSAFSHFTESVVCKLIILFISLLSRKWILDSTTCLDLLCLLRIEFSAFHNDSFEVFFSSGHRSSCIHFQRPPIRPRFYF